MLLLQAGIKNASKLYFTVLYLASMISEILFPSYFGSKLLDISERLTYAIYSSDWTERNAKCKRAYLIFVERTCKAMAMFAGGLFLLSLPTFVSLIMVLYPLTEISNCMIIIAHNNSIFRFVEVPIRCSLFWNKWVLVWNKVCLYWMTKESVNENKVFAEKGAYFL